MKVVSLHNERRGRLVMVTHQFHERLFCRLSQGDQIPDELVGGRPATAEQDSPTFRQVSVFGANTVGRKVLL